MNFTYFTPISINIKLFQKVSQILKSLRLSAEMSQVSRIQHEMITTEQRINIYHFMQRVLACGVEGEVIELGHNISQSALQIQSILMERGYPKSFHVYDCFSQSTSDDPDIINEFIERQMRIPVLHNGLFENILPGNLPAKIAFAYINCSRFEGNSALSKKKFIIHCLNSIYPRLVPSGICLLIDYHHSHKIMGSYYFNGKMKLACDVFFADKPEKACIIPGNDYSHGIICREKQTPEDQFIKKSLVA